MLSLYQILHMSQKPIIWTGTTLADVQGWPTTAKQRMGYQLHLLQRGDDPTDWKPMPSVGNGVREIRVRADGGAWRVIYLTTRPEGVYILHVFQKKAQATRKADLDTAKARLKALD